MEQFRFEGKNKNTTFEAQFCTPGVVHHTLATLLVR